METQHGSVGFTGHIGPTKKLSKTYQKLLVENDLEKFGRFLLGYLAAIHVDQSRSKKSRDL